MTASKWSDWPMLGFDTETTGVNIFDDRIVQTALVRINPGHRPATKTWLVNPGVPIPDGAAEVHGITTERAVAEGGDPKQMLYEAAGQLALAMGRGIPIVGMNLAFDLTLFEAECQRHGVDGLAARLGHASKIAPIIDVGVLDKQADPYRKGGRKLVQLCEVYGVRHTGAHDATADALATCRIWPLLMAKHARKVKASSIQALHQSQIGWRQSQADGLRAYFDKNGTEHDGVCGEWPVHRACAPALVGGAR